MAGISSAIASSPILKKNLEESALLIMVESLSAILSRPRCVWTAGSKVTRADPCSDLHCVSHRTILQGRWSSARQSGLRRLICLQFRWCVLECTEPQSSGAKPNPAVPSVHRPCPPRWSEPRTRAARGGAAVSGACGSLGAGGAAPKAASNGRTQAL